MRTFIRTCTLLIMLLPFTAGATANESASMGNTQLIEMHPHAETVSAIQQNFPAPSATLCLNKLCAAVSTATPSNIAAHVMTTTRPSGSYCFNSSGQPAAVPFDMNGDCVADIYWMNDQTHQFGWWLLYPSDSEQGALNRYVSQIVNVTPGYRVAATGDFWSNGRADMIWTSDSRDLYMWTGTGLNFASSYVGTYPAGWTLVGAADIDGDGYDDLIWENQSQCEYGYWSMRGDKVISKTTIAVTCGYHINFVETAFDSPNGITPAIYWEGQPNSSGTVEAYQWLPQGPTFNASLYGYFPSNWKFVAGMHQQEGAYGSPLVNEMLFNAVNADSTDTVFWSEWWTNGNDNFQGSSLMPGYQIVAAGHFTGTCSSCNNKQEILWANQAGNLAIWSVTLDSREEPLEYNWMGGTGFSLPNFPASAGWYVVRPGVQN